MKCFILLFGLVGFGVEAPVTESVEEEVIIHAARPRRSMVRRAQRPVPPPPPSVRPWELPADLPTPIVLWRACRLQRPPPAF